MRAIERGGRAIERAIVCAAHWNFYAATRFRKQNLNERRLLLSITYSSGAGRASRLIWRSFVCSLARLHSIKSGRRTKNASRRGRRRRRRALDVAALGAQFMQSNEHSANSFLNSKSGRHSRRKLSPPAACCTTATCIVCKSPNLRKLMILVNRFDLWRRPAA